MICGDSGQGEGGPGQPQPEDAGGRDGMWNLGRTAAPDIQLL